MPAGAIAITINYVCFAFWFFQPGVQCAVDQLQTVLRNLTGQVRGESVGTLAGFVETLILEVRSR